MEIANQSTFRGVFCFRTVGVEGVGNGGVEGVPIVREARRRCKRSVLIKLRACIQRKIN